MDLTLPGQRLIAVEIEGGQIDIVPVHTSTTMKYVVDEAATEILLLDQRGKLQVRSSALDRFDVGRAEREKQWRKWVEKTDVESRMIPKVNNN